MASRIASIMFAALLCLGVSSLAFAQAGNEDLSPFARGAGGTYAVTARGLDAVGVNPALLSLGTPRPFEISIFPFSSYGANAGPSFKQLNTISSGLSDSGKAVNDDFRAQVVDLLFQNKLSGRADGRLFGLSYSNADIGTFALTWNMHAGLSALLPDSLLYFFGQDAKHNLLEGILTTQTNFDLQAQWYSAYELSYGRSLISDTAEGSLQLDAGAGLKYIAGIAYFNLDPTSSVSLRGEHFVFINVKYEMRFAYPDQFDPKHLPTAFTFDLLTGATAGSGFGGDIGLLLRPRADKGPSPWTLGLSVSDIGSITWRKHTDRRYLDTSLSINYQNAVGNSINDSLSALNGHLDTTDAPFTTLLPTTLHVAGSIDLAGLGIAPDGFEFSAAAEYAHGLSEAVGAPHHGRFGLAAILTRPSENIAFHTALGMTTQDGITDLTFAAGVGFWNRVLLDLGTNGVGGLFSSTGHSDAAFSLKILF